MREIGYIMSGCSQNLVPFVVKETEKAYVNKYYFISHPTQSRGDLFAPVLIRVFRVTPYNPEMSRGRPGPIAGKKGEPAHYGKQLEYDVAWAEVLGYFNENGKWYGLECAPGTWDPVFEPDAEEIESFFAFTSNHRPNGAPMLEQHLVQIGRHRGLTIPIFLDLNGIAKAHLFVAGMTRSGKSCFILNLIRKTSYTNPRPHFIIFDRRGEYSTLAKYGAIVVPYRHFLPKADALTCDVVANRLGFDSRGSAGKAVRDAVEALFFEGKDLTGSTLWEKVNEMSSFTLSRDRNRILERIHWAISTKGGFLDEKIVTMDIIAAVFTNPIIIIDLSVDTDIDAQHIAVKHVIKTIIDHAMARKNEGDFSAILVVEEAQYFAPEKGLNIEVGNPEKIGVDKQLVEAISQAGGYNIGFIVLTQRPAYIQKSIISQCNTVVCFRLMAGNDQDAILKYTEYGNERLRDYLPGLADHEAIIWGAASPTPFPAIGEIEVKEYPQKAGVTARQAWDRMRQILSREPII